METPETTLPDRQASNATVVNTTSTEQHAINKPSTDLALVYLVIFIYSTCNAMDRKVRCP